MDREPNVSGILSETFDVIGGAGRAIIIYILALGLFSGMGGLFGLASLDDSLLSARWGVGGFDTETAGLFESVFSLGAFVLFVVASYFLLVQMMKAIGRPIPKGPRFWGFVGMSVLAAIGVMVGIVLIIIPGLILLVRWSAANGFVLRGEHGVTGSLGASWKATDGHGLSIFGAGLLLWIGLAVLGSVIGGVILATGLATGSGAFSPLIAIFVALSSFIEAFNNAASFAFSIAVFHLVAPADTSVADVFD